MMMPTTQRAIEARYSSQMYIRPSTVVNMSSQCSLMYAAIY